MPSTNCPSPGIPLSPMLPWSDTRKSPGGRVDANRRRCRRAALKSEGKSLAGAFQGMRNKPLLPECCRLQHEEVIGLREELRQIRDMISNHRGSINSLSATMKTFDPLEAAIPLLESAPIFKDIRSEFQDLKQVFSSKITALGEGLDQVQLSHSNTGEILHRLSRIETNMADIMSCVQSTRLGEVTSNRSESPPNEQEVQTGKNQEQGKNEESRQFCYGSQFNQFSHWATVSRFRNV